MGVMGGAPADRSNHAAEYCSEGNGNGRGWVDQGMMREEWVPPRKKREPVKKKVREPVNHPGSGGERVVQLGSKTKVYLLVQKNCGTAFRVSPNPFTCKDV